MGFIQIGASILTALLIGALTRGARPLRTYLLLAASVVAVYWFQPALPLRSFDFWLPSLSLALTVLTWFVISQAGGWRLGHNLIGLVIIVGLSTLIELSRYFLPEPLLTATTPPSFFLYFAFLLLIGIALAFWGWISRRWSWTMT